ncbi:hypothetical protein DL768_010420 [Monosporascus sp. mg162]|nr:hypothetical protein DL768_010420 [Monosporascus sp. mg162]
MNAARSLFLIALIGRVVSAAYTVPPPTEAPEDTIEDCTNWVVGSASDTCEAIADDYFITLAQLYKYNPSLADSCHIQEGLSYCVEENWGIPPVPTTTTSSAPPSTTSGNGISTPTPTQSGMVGTCNKFHYVEKGQSCADVLGLYNLNIETFYSWNKGVGETCSSMWAQVYVCVGVVGTSTTTTATSATTTGNGVSTPTPTQPGMVSNCNKFHYVEKGQGCADILARYSLNIETFYSWNTGVGETCTSMWAQVYVCVGVIGGGGSVTPTTPPTSTTTSGNGISTPTPTQPGMVSNCDKFDFVAKGTSCSDVLSRNKITIDQLYAWNKGVGKNCEGMWADVYVCVHAIGAPTATITSTTKTTGNGVPTPTPTMPGMVGNCKKFYKVASGDNCSVISTKTGVSVANIIKWNPQVGASCNVWLNYYICIGV